jgi:hypothetical protein
MLPEDHQQAAGGLAQLVCRQRLQENAMAKHNRCCLPVAMPI